MVADSVKKNQDFAYLLFSREGRFVENFGVITPSAPREYNFYQSASTFHPGETTINVSSETTTLSGMRIIQPRNWRERRGPFNDDHPNVIVRNYHLRPADERRVQTDRLLSRPLEEFASHPDSRLIREIKL